MSPERSSPVERLCQSAERQKEKEIRRSPLTGEKKENVMREKTIREAEACDSRGWTRMTRAAFTGNIGEMKELLDGGCDVNSQDNMGMTPLHWARTTEMMSYLIDSGANPEIRDNCGMSVLTATVFYACDESITERVKLLLDAGADVDVEDGEGRSPLQLAVDRGLPEVPPCSSMPARIPMPGTSTAGQPCTLQPDGETNAWPKRSYRPEQTPVSGMTREKRPLTSPQTPLSERPS